jgi:hypothetical protein
VTTVLGFEFVASVVCGAWGALAPGARVPAAVGVSWSRVPRCHPDSNAGFHHRRPVGEFVFFIMTSHTILLNLISRDKKYCGILPQKCHAMVNGFSYDEVVPDFC